MNIYCANCENECSEAAQACPKCGHPLGGPPLSPSIVEARPIDQLAVAVQQAPERPPVVVRPVQTVQPIEKTGKEWKAMMLLGGLLMVAGVGLCCIGWPNVDIDTGYIPNAIRLGGLICGFGVLMFIAAKLGAWWYHG